MSQYDDYDLSSEIEEEREERFHAMCAKRDMDQGICPNWGDSENEQEENE
jgi:hypothetical protein